MKNPYLFIGSKLSRETKQWLYDQEVEYVEVNAETAPEKLENKVFNVFLFFSPAGIESYRNSGYFPPPDAHIMVNSGNTAQEAWRYFTNKVHLIDEAEELSFIQYSIARWMRENHK
jgi:hypothetical protein